MSVTAQLPDGREIVYYFREGTLVGAAETRIRDACLVRGGLITNPDGVVMFPEEHLHSGTVYLFKSSEGRSPICNHCSQLRSCSVISLSYTVLTAVYLLVIIAFQS
jgi:hypothetical protein